MRRKMRLKLDLLLWVGMGQAIRLYRKILRKTTRIGVTGSCGKTTTKELIAAVLGTRYRVVKSPGSNNMAITVVKTLLRTRLDHDALVQEIGAFYPGSLDLPVSLLKPHIAVVTHIMGDHFRRFHSREAIALEKSKLVRSLPPSGKAILNADDPLVWAMRLDTPAEVIPFGLSEGAAIRAEDVSSRWPARLTGTLIFHGERIPFKTQLCGSYWIYAVLAAVAVGVALEISPFDALQAIATVQPLPGRMNPVETSEGLTFIEDHWKSPLDVLASCFDFFRDAQAKRKIMVIGHISDYAGASTPKYIQVARKASEWCDQVILVSPFAGSVFNKTRKGPEARRITAFEQLQTADRYLREVQAPGDLVLLKGSGADHLERLILTRQKPVTCWQRGCGRKAVCNTCKKLWK